MMPVAMPPSHLACGVEPDAAQVWPALEAGQLPRAARAAAPHFSALAVERYCAARVAAQHSVERAEVPLQPEVLAAVPFGAMRQAASLVAAQGLSASSISCGKATRFASTL